MTPADVKWVHVEMSSNCNAWCPACPRNERGFGIADGFVIEDLSLEKLEYTLSNLPNLDGVQFCGNYGDPIIAKNIMEAIDIAIKYSKKIQIHTNGSLRSTQWWSELGAKLKDVTHDIWFGIDGIGDTHAIYRQGTSYEKIIQNAKAFIDAGGYATWQFIPFAHNESQAVECLKISRKMGFANFKLVKLYRTGGIARNYKTGEEFELNPPTEFQQIIRVPKSNKTVMVDKCMHLTQPGIYLAADGKLSHCCYHGFKTKFDTLEELFYNSIDLSNPLCRYSCGS